MTLPTACSDMHHYTGAEGEQPYARCPGCSNYLALPAARQRAENDLLRAVEATAACVVDIYRGNGGHEGGMHGALEDLADALDAMSEAIR